ncbi:TetR family transcriptional regulator [Diaphorobacter sp. JS3050]|uniref:TetR family transcriptional regulator n=1 Tax=unclassified Diaphorobacter TaxID=2649760 RepID=UPI0000DCDC4F|nr:MULTISPECIES: TetR family transcriptional regulator [unclassified Diaphorobacter]ABM40577.1 transcriptional regulator, TetR family [Acidovorax sp. JS42]QJY31803.1 TetR family transcriptional regulator [Diaphorobacter sp. JS3050]QPN29491.1 TetR family transcriptional regulator [Diaphorobacter sp. JS3051]
MARRTKADAAATRNGLLDAAEHVFYEKGVSRASLADIATVAGTTRGAIYWHFKDKADLFNAMLDRVTHPLMQAIEDTQGMAHLARLRGLVQGVQGAVAHDERMRRVFEIALYRVEYVEDFEAVKRHHVAGCAAFQAQIARELGLAAAAQGIDLPLSAPVAAMGVQALFDGLLQSWLLNDANFDLEAASRQTIDAYLRGLGFCL